MVLRSNPQSVELTLPVHPGKPMFECHVSAMLGIKLYQVTNMAEVSTCLGVIHELEISPGLS